MKPVTGAHQHEDIDDGVSTWPAPPLWVLECNLSPKSRGQFGRISVYVYCVIIPAYVGIFKVTRRNIWWNALRF